MSSRCTWRGPSANVYPTSFGSVDEWKQLLLQLHLWIPFNVCLSGWSPAVNPAREQIVGWVARSHQCVAETETGQRQRQNDLTYISPAGWWGLSSQEQTIRVVILNACVLSQLILQWWVTWISSNTPAALCFDNWSQMGYIYIYCIFYAERFGKRTASSSHFND